MSLTTSRTDSAESYRRILAAARSILARDGYGDFSMRAVAARAGLTAGAIYRHFANREELIDRVVHESLIVYELELTRAMATEPAGSFARVVALGRKYIEFASTHSEQFKVLFSPLRDQPRRLSELPGKAGFALLEQCVAEAMETGQIRRGDPALTAFFLWSRVHGIVMLMLACDFSDDFSKEVLTPERMFGATREFTLHGIAPRE